MKDQRLEIKEIVKHIDDATLGKLDVPEFQQFGKSSWPTGLQKVSFFPPTPASGPDSLKGSIAVRFPRTS
jgi:hypothetical protein